MEALLVILGLAVVAWVLLIPIFMLVRSHETRERLRELQQRFDSLYLEVQQLRREGRESRPPQTATPPTPKPTEVPTPVRETSAPQPPISVAAPSPHLPPPLIVQGPPPSSPPPRPAPTPHSPPLIPPLSRPPSPPKAPFNWERFVGVKLIAWLGGLVLFLAAAYFVKYSFEQNLIPPEVRVCFGFLLGIALVVGGFALKRKAYKVTSQTFCATGTLILYAVTFACRAVYHFEPFTPSVTFSLMVMIAATAFLLAVRMDAIVVAVLGMVGGFLTPVILSTGQDNPLGLFVYIALLDLGLLAVAMVRPWSFLVGLAALGTVMMEVGWTSKFLVAEKLPVAGFSQIGFNLLFILAMELASRRRRPGNEWTWAPAGMAVVSLLYAVCFVPHSTIGPQLGWLGAIAFAADLCLLALVFRRTNAWWLQWVGGALLHGFLAFWMSTHLTPARLTEILGAVFLAAVIHTGFPILLSRLRPQTPGIRWAQISPPAALLLMLIPLTTIPAPSLLLWPMIFLVDLLAIGLAVATRSVVGVIAGLVLTTVLGAAWVSHLSNVVFELTPLLVVIGMIAVLFFAGALFLARKLMTATPLSDGSPEGGADARDQQAMMAQLPALSAVMPFLLLIFVTFQIPLPNPSAVFALGTALVILMLGVVRNMHQPVLALIGLVGSVGLQLAWHQTRSNWESAPGLALMWHASFSLIAFAFPLIFAARMKESVLPWAASALSFPLHFGLFYRVIQHGWPNEFMGLLPAVLSIPALISVVRATRLFEVGHPLRLNVLAWLGGGALFLITLIFPTQFDRQWITVSWALEGAALCWLFHRLPHPGLRWTGAGLLLVAFIRLALNPAVLSYHVRGNTPIFNWYLYSFGTVILALFAAARLLAPPQDRSGALRFPPLFDTLATVLLFLLVNIEIADYFTAPGTPALAFQFSGNFARDMSYTIAWGIFALGLVAVGIRWRLKAARFAGLALIGLVLLKLFFHDLSQLAQLYRIGALAGVAVVAILASVLYQKFVAAQDKSEAHEPPPIP